MKKIGLTLVLFTLTVFQLFSQVQDPDYKKQFVGTSLFMLANFLPESASFYQLNYGYRITTKDVLIAEAITWTYKAPLGIPYGPSYEAPEENFPGYVRDFGIGLAYQRYFYKGLYSTIHAIPFLQQYFTPEDIKIQTGFQLFCTVRVGYHFSFFKNRIYLEPSITATTWPVNTNMPESFQLVDENWPGYFLFEPGLHIGFNF
jgi:hypothetical protein